MTSPLLSKLIGPDWPVVVRALAGAEGGDAFLVGPAGRGLAGRRSVRHRRVPPETAISFDGDGGSGVVLRGGGGDGGEVDGVVRFGGEGHVLQAGVDGHEFGLEVRGGEGPRENARGRRPGRWSRGRGRTG